MTHLFKSVKPMWLEYRQRPFPSLVRLFLARMLQGEGEEDGQGLNIGTAVTFVVLAMPGLLTSLLLLNKYGSLLRFLMGVRPVFDPFRESIPDEYYFIVLSMVVAGSVAVWKWDSIFLSHRDYANLVPLPLSFIQLFLGNLIAIFVLAAAFTVDANAVSSVLFPIAVLASQGTISMWIVFTIGHVLTALAASAFTFSAVFAIAGLLMAVFPFQLFQRISLYVRFLMGLCIFSFLATSPAVSGALFHHAKPSAAQISLLPPIWFMGLCESLWGRGDDSFFSAMAGRAFVSLLVSATSAGIAYALCFRRFFVRIPDALPGSRVRRVRSILPNLAFRFLDAVAFRMPPERASFRFTMKTLFRSQIHLQTVLVAVALGLVVSSQLLLSALNHRAPRATGPALSVEYLSISFALAYCISTGVRFSLEIPYALQANWVFKYWVPSTQEQPRQIARTAILFVTLLPILPISFVLAAALSTWTTAIFHSLTLVLCIVTLTEIMLVRFRKIPFTCSYPSFRTGSTLVLLAYFAGFYIFVTYLPQIEFWCISQPTRFVLIAMLFVAILIGLHFYRDQLLEMDKVLIFEEDSR
jgi:hypothetical protein